MEKQVIENDITTFGFRVKTFPDGIGEAFNELIQKTGDCASERNYYGISYMQEGNIIYNVAAEEKQEGEAEKYKYSTFIIEAGNYVIEKLDDWQTKTNCIKDVFSKMMQQENVDTKRPAIEWYKNDKEMLCMIKAKAIINLK